MEMELDLFTELLRVDENSESESEIARQIIAGLFEGIFVGMPKLMTAVTNLLNTEDLDSFMKEIDNDWFAKLAVVASILGQSSDETAGFTDVNTVVSSMNDFMNNTYSDLMAKIERLQEEEGA